MRVAVVDYGSGNLASASRALALAAERLGLNAEVKITADPDWVAKADRIVLPGQGAFADCSAGLAAVSGMYDAIETATTRGNPFRGISVGMQLMAQRGLEHAVTPGFGWIAGDVGITDPSVHHLVADYGVWPDYAAKVGGAVVVIALGKFFAARAAERRKYSGKHLVDLETGN